MNTSTTEPLRRQTASIAKACELVGVSRRTIYNWMRDNKVEWVETASGTRRIYVDTLWNVPLSPEAQARGRLGGLKTAQSSAFHE